MSQHISAIVAAITLYGCGGSPPPAPPTPPSHDDHAMAMPMPSPGRGASLAISCGPEVQSQFDRGFVALHNMDYVQARKIFDEARAAHATCAMLDWGLAMTYFQPLWPGQATAESLKDGAEAVARAQASSATATEPERQYIAAVATYYDNYEHTDTAARYKQWAAGQKHLAELYPDDLEAQAFFALSRLANVDKKDKTYAEQLAVAELLQKLLEKRPDHPGLMHYLLHAYDNPKYADHAVDIAHHYEHMSPDAAHSLHMPSHIYVRLGKWQEVIDGNIKSADAALKHPAANGRVSRDFLHATDYMTYGYLQLGDDEHAKAVATKIDPATSYELSSGPGAYALAATPARFALERRMFKDAASLVPRKVPYNWEQYPWAEAVTYAARGLGAARSGDPTTAEKSIVELDRLKPLVESPWWKGRVQIERDVVAAWIAHGRKDDKKAEELLRGAAAKEIASSKDSVEPGHVIPAIEELGDLLLELKRPKEALEAFKTALEDSPRRFNALLGAGTAAELAGDVDQAKTYYAQLVQISSAATTRPGRARAQTFLTSRP